MTKNGTIPSEDDSLAALFPEPVNFKVGDTVAWEILPMDLMTCTRFAAKAKPIIREATAALADNKISDGKAFIGAVALAASDHPDALLEALALATGKDSKTIGKLPPGVAFTLIQVVLRVNADFFAHAVGSLAFESQPTPTAEPAGANGAGPTH
jgi:hypothetical protein